MSLLSQASLCVTPNAYKEGKLYSVIPSDGSGDMSVTRATTATRVNSAGLVELVPYNLVGYSEQFNNAAWATNLLPTITANTTTAPNGTLTADTIAAGGANSGVYQVPTVSTGAAYSFSVYVKNVSSATAITIGCDLNPINATLSFNAVSGTITSVGAGITASSVTNEGDGWFRVFGTYVATNTPNTFVLFGGGVMSFAVWGAQLVEGSVAKPYQKTETRLNIPRLDYSNGTCPSLLVEPQRTNFITYSEDVNSCFPSKSNTTVTSNSTTSPDGTINADLVAFTGANAYVLRGQTVNATTTYTMSVFVKNNNFASGENLIFNMSDGIIGGLKANIDVFNKTATFSGAGGAYTNISGKVEDYGNGWFRVICTGTSIAGGGGWYEIATAGITRSCYLWGMSLEVGSYATSYIPTTSASVTRNADVISKTGISSLIGQTEGVVFVDFDCRSSANTGSYDTILNISTDVNNSIDILKNNTTAELYIFAINGGTIQVNSVGIAGTNVLGSHKVALAYKNNDYVCYLDGVQVFTDTSASVPTCSNLFLGQYISGSTQLGGGIKAAALWKTRLTNTQLAQLTTI